MDAASGEVIEVELQNGVVIIEGNNGVFMEPVRVLNSGYDMHDVKFERYYSRAFFTSVSMPSSGVTNEGSDTRKRKRKTVYNLNEKEVLAENRHQVSLSVSFRMFTSINLASKSQSNILVTVCRVIFSVIFPPSLI